MLFAMLCEITSTDFNKLMDPLINSINYITPPVLSGGGNQDLVANGAGVQSPTTPEPDYSNIILHEPVPSALQDSYNNSFASLPPSDLSANQRDAGQLASLGTLTEDLIVTTADSTAANNTLSSQLLAINQQFLNEQHELYMQYYAPGAPDADIIHDTQPQDAAENTVSTVEHIASIALMGSTPLLFSDSEAPPFPIPSREHHTPTQAELVHNASRLSLGLLGSLGRGNTDFARQTRLRELLSQVATGHMRHLGQAHFFKSFGESLAPTREIIERKDVENPNASPASLAGAATEAFSAPSVPQSEIRAASQNFPNSETGVKASPQALAASVASLFTSPLTPRDTVATSISPSEVKPIPNKSPDLKLGAESRSQTALASATSFSNEPFIHPDSGLTSAAVDTNEARAIENNGAIFAASNDINISPSSMDTVNNALQANLKQSLTTLRSLQQAPLQRPINVGQR